MIDSLIINSPKRRLQQSVWNECFPYYAGFPLSFAQDIIQSSQLPAHGVILDPWNGSGTTTYAASKLGYKSIGIDINPVMVLIARARDLQTSEADSIEPQAREIAKSASRMSGKNLEADPLSVWFNSETTRVIRAIEKRIRACLVTNSSSEACAGYESVSCFASTFYVALFSICRTWSRRFQSSNPTWLRIPHSTEEKIALSSSDITSTFIEQAKRMAVSLRAQRKQSELAFSRIFVGDSTGLQNRNVADLILTSPPYCTRIDYTAATRIELAVASPLLTTPMDELSRSMIGSVKVPLRSISPNDSWGASCIRFLEQLSRHESKASTGYYYKTHVDYFDKMSRSMSNVSRMLKPGGSALLVVQDSYYKEIHNDVAQMIIEMGSGFKLNLKRREDYRQGNTIAGINTRARLYRKTTGATESVLCFQKKPSRKS